MSEQTNQQTEENVITFSEIFILIKKYFWHVVLIMLLCVAVASVLSAFIAKPKYSASAEIMIDYVPEGSTVANDRNALLYGLELFPTVKDFANTDVVARHVALCGDSELVDFKYAKGLELIASDDSLIITVKYTTTKSQETAIATVNQVVDSIIAVANSVDEEGKAKYSALNGNIKLTSPADEKTARTSQTWLIYVLKGFVGGLLISGFYVLVKYFTDDTVKSKSELERLTGFKAIAYITKFELND